MQIGRYGTVLEILSGISQKAVFLSCDRLYSNEGYRQINYFVRDFRISKNGKESVRTLGFNMREEAENVQCGDILDLRKHNMIFRNQKSPAEYGFDIYCEEYDVYDQLKDVCPDNRKNLYVGKKCKVREHYPCGTYRIIGFVPHKKDGCHVLFDWDCWWFSVPLSEIKYAR